MGNTVTCPCNKSNEGAIVMMEDGRLLRFRKGIRAKEVMESHEKHLVVRCDSDRLVLPGSAELESNRLHFLMPEELTRCPNAYLKFWKAGERRGLIPPTWRRGEGDVAQQPVGSRGQVFMFESSDLRSTWRPQLKTIPEITSPPTAAPT